MTEDIARQAYFDFFARLDRNCHCLHDTENGREDNARSSDLRTLRERLLAVTKCGRAKKRTCLLLVVRALSLAQQKESGQDLKLRGLQC
jgi:hypothetical protein